MTRYVLCAALAAASLAAGDRGPFHLVPAELPWAVVDKPYAPPSLTSTGGDACSTGDVSITMATGRLPDGLEISNQGDIYGTPRRVGAYDFTLRVSNPCAVGFVPYRILVLAAPILVVQREKLEFTYKAGSPAPASQLVEVGSNWPDLPYSLDVEGGNWLEARPRRGRTPRTGGGFTADIVEVRVLPGGLAPGQYDGRIRVSTWQGTNAPMVAVRIKVEK